MTLLSALSPAQATEFGAAIGNGGMNLKPSTVPRLAGALLDLQDGVVPSRLLVATIGSSTLANVVTGTDKKGRAWLERSIPLIQQYAPKVAKAGMFGTNGMSLANLSSYDPRFVSFGAGVALDTTPSIGGFGIQMASATGPVVWQEDTPYDTVNVYTTSGGGARDLGVQIGAGSVTNYNTPAFGFQKNTLTKALGQEAITFSKGASTGSVIQGIDCYNSADPRVRFANMGRAGFSSVDWVGNADARAPFQALRAIQPLAIIIDIGPNEWRFGVPVATMKANVQSIIDNNKDLADVILASPFPGQLSAYPTQGDYQQALRELAISNNLPLIDFTRSLESWEISSPQGYYRGGDTTHLTDIRGNAKEARFFARAFRTLIGFD